MHKLQMYENLMDMLEREVKEIAQQDSLNTQSLDELKKLMSAKHYVTECIKEEKGEGMSFRGSYDGMSRRSFDGSSYRDSYEGSYARRGRDGDGDGRYSEDNFRYSQDRGRSYDDSYGYSRDGAKKDMLTKLERMIDEPIGENERLAIMDCIKKIK